MTGSTALVRFRSLDLTVRRRLDGRAHGDHLGTRLGPGTEAEELSPYRPGHDVRRIDWKVTARAREPYVWRTRAEHELDTWLLWDRTPSMAFGTAAAEKAELATTAVAASGLLLDAPGDRLGIGVLDATGLGWSRPEPGRVAAHRVLSAPEPPRDGGSGSADLAAALDDLGRRHRRPGLRIVVSDLLDPSGESRRPLPWERSLRRLAARHDVLVIEVLDPRELELPAVGQLTLVDPESGRQREVWTGDHRLRSAYAVAAAEHRLATAAGCREAGAGHVVLRTDGDWVADLARFVRRRQRSRSVRPRAVRS